jgi:hypothetical protein
MEVLVLRTVTVLVTGTVLGIAVLLILFFLIVYHVPERFNSYSYFALKALVGTAVGLYVGYLQKTKAALVAVICLLPGLILQATSRSYPIRIGLGIAIFLLGDALGLVVAFAIAHRLSNSRKSAPTRTVSG